MDKYGNKGFQIVGFPCNQFGLQENFNNPDIPNLLQYVRPGNGFKPKFPLSEKIHVNGLDTIPLFKWLKESVPCEPDKEDRWVIDERPHYLATGPCGPGDLRWNFEMFLLDREAKEIKRYHPGKFSPSEIASDVEAFLEKPARL